MDTKDVILELRTKKGLSQDELAEKLYVTRQAVSRWENGETIPNTETLKLLSKFFDVSINTLLGSPRQLICQCCGMPLDDSSISKEPDGTFNEEYCKWCYSEGKFTYNNTIKRDIPEKWTVGSLINNPLAEVIQPGVDYFDTKNYLATKNINGTTISDGDYVTYENRESRANMQPSINSVWFAKMIIVRRNSTLKSV